VRFVNGISQRIWALMVSRKLAVWLLATVVLMLAVGAFLPNPSLLPEDYREELKRTKPLIYYLGKRYNSEKLAQGYLFGFIGVFLIVSTTACSVDRLLKWKRTRPSGDVPDEVFLKMAISVKVGQDQRETVLSRLETFLKKLRMRTTRRQGLIVGYRGEVGYWGSIFFHAILITALFGLVIYYLGGYRAYMVITEGQSIRLRKDAFFYLEKVPLWGLRVPEAVVTLKSVYNIYAPQDPWTAIDHIVKLDITDINSGRVSEKTVKINKPIRIGGKVFLLESGGYSPMVILLKGKKTVFKGYLNLRNQSGRRDYIVRDNIRLDITLYPDYYSRDGVPSTRTPQLKNPFFELVFFKDGHFLKRAIVPMGGTMKVDEYTVHIPDVRRWVMLKMIGEPGVGFFFLASVFGILAELVRFLDPDERLYIRFRNGYLEIYPYSKYFTALLRERVMQFIGTLEEIEQ